MDKIQILIQFLSSGNLPNLIPPLADCSVYDHLVLQTLIRRHQLTPATKRRERVAEMAKQPWLKKWLDGNNWHEITAKLSSVALAERARLN